MTRMISRGQARPKRKDEPREGSSWELFLLGLDKERLKSFDLVKSQEDNQREEEGQADRSSRGPGELARVKGRERW